jgi:hypothetical protein
MNPIRPIIFLIPIIACTIIVILYFALLKHTPQKKTFNKLIFKIAIIAFILNLIWELLHLPLYYHSSYDLKHISFCTLASLADVIMVLLLYLCFAVAIRNPFWIMPLNWIKCSSLIFTGGIGAVLSEMRHLSLGSWTYANQMPLIPIINVGLSPVLQFMILPLLTYFISYHLLKTSRIKN